jgi:outer membrane biosynthesis protein TonB
MGLMDKLLSRAGTAEAASGDKSKRVHARVLLDDAGRVQAVVLKQGSGDPAIDQRALDELHAKGYPAPRLGSKTSRRWHNVVWTCEA